MKWALQLESGEVLTLSESLPPEAFRQTASKVFVLPDADRDPCLHVFEVTRQADEVLFLGKLHQLHVTPSGNRKVESFVVGLEVDGHRFFLVLHPHKVEVKHERI